jgi:sugar/nucleoside kinase (ribokinase family)
VTTPPDRPHRVGAIGLLAWDLILAVDSYPAAGDYRVVRQSIEQSGGTTGNLAAALALLGVDVALASKVGDDEYGERLRTDLRAAGCSIQYVTTRPGEPSDRGIIIVSGDGASSERTIFWQQGARPRHGDPLPIEEFFSRDLVIIDVDDARLRQLLVDLPMHVSPRTRLLGTLTFLVEHAPDVGLDLALRHDYLAGNRRELFYLTGEASLERAIESLQREMIWSQVRFAAISLGASGCVMVTCDASIPIPAFQIEAVDPTGAGDAFAAGVAFGILERWDHERIGRFANAMGALAASRLGARSGLRGRAEVEQFLETATPRRVEP